jgi:CHAT domain-containing protein
MKDHEEAVVVLKKVLANMEATKRVGSATYAAALHSLGVSQTALLRYKEAEASLKRALEIREKALGKAHPDTARTLHALAMLRKAMGDTGSALPLIEEGLAAVSAKLRQDAAFMSDRQQLAAANALRHFLDARLSLPDKEGYPSAAAHDLAWKGAVLVRQQQRRLFVRLSGDDAAREAVARLQGVVARLAALRQTPDTPKEEIENLEAEQEAVQSRLSGLSEAFAASRKSAAPDAAAITKLLPEGAVLVDYLFHGGELTAFVHRRGAEPARVDLGDAKPIDEAVTTWRRLLHVRRTAREDAGAKVKALVWEKLETHIKDAKVVLVSPDGSLGSVPFAALPGSKEGRYLIEDVAVAVVPVPAAVPALLAPVREEDRLPPSLLVAGSIRYDPDEGAAKPGGTRSGREVFTRLPGTRPEMNSVRGSFVDMFEEGRVISLREGKATKAATRRALCRVRYAHIATHGFFAAEEANKGEWHPMLLSGLALTDANSAPRDGGEDGILTALEVSEMDLSRLELAVMSACETGLGKVAGGEGVLGLQRAFQAAGARSVISSLWCVDDKATQQLMSEFYTAAWDSDKIISRAESLRAAQLSMLRDGVKRGMAREDDVKKGETRLPPYYWAAFVLSGDWR